MSSQILEISEMPIILFIISTESQTVDAVSKRVPEKVMTFISHLILEFHIRDWMSLLCILVVHTCRILFALLLLINKDGKKVVSSREK